MTEVKKRAGWHLILIWLLAAAAMYFFVLSSPNDDSITADSALATSMGAGLLPFLFAWIASRVGPGNSTVWAWAVGLIMIIIMLISYPRP